MRLDIGEDYRKKLRSEFQASKGTGSEVIIDVTGQNRVAAEKSLTMLEPRLDNVYIVAVLDPEHGEFRDRLGVLENSAGERPSEFYSDYFGDSAEVMVSPVELEGLDNCTEEV